MKKAALSAGLLFLTAFAMNVQPSDFPKLAGPYLGQKAPGLTPEVFAPGVVSTCLDELNSVFSPDGREFYFCVRNMGASSLFVMKCVDGVWGRPEPLPFAGPYDDIDVSLSPDGLQLFFCSNRPVSGSGSPKQDHDIWTCERRGASWGPPVHLGEAVNSPRDDFSPLDTRVRARALGVFSRRSGLILDVGPFPGTSLPPWRECIVPGIQSELFSIGCSSIISSAF